VAKHLLTARQVQTAPVGELYVNLITDSGIRKDSPLGEMRRLLAISTKAGSQLQGLHVKAECKAATDV